MAVGDNQRFITQILSEVLGEEAQTEKSFFWFVNKHLEQNFKSNFHIVNSIFHEIGGNEVASLSKRTQQLNCDAFFGGIYNFMFEFDEYQHFSSARLTTLSLYPEELPLNFPMDKWKEYSKSISPRADRYRKGKTTKDFPFHGGRTAQRAYLDSFRDLLPSQHGLNPTFRIAEHEVQKALDNPRSAHSVVEAIVKERLSL